jgi:hypothetical protein
VRSVIIYCDELLTDRWRLLGATAHLWRSGAHIVRYRAPSRNVCGGKSLILLVGAVGIEPLSLLQARNLLILRVAKTFRNRTNAKVRYTEGTRSVMRCPKEIEHRGRPYQPSR